MESQIEDSMENSSSVNLEPKREISQPRKSGFLWIMVFLIICLAGGLTYYVLKDNEIDLLKSATEFEDSKATVVDTDTNTTTTENDETSTIKPTKKAGNFKVIFAYPSETTPAVRLCFTNTKEISEQYCFWRKGNGDKTNYSNDLENGKGTLPIGTYSVDYTVYQEEGSVYQVYSLRQCVYYADGGENNAANVAKYCSSIKKLFNDYLTKLGGSGNMPDQLVNSSEYGGNLVTFTIKENQVTDLGTISLSPYITD